MQVTKFIENDNARTISGTLRPSGRFSVCQIFPRKSKGFENVKTEAPAKGVVLSVQEIDKAYARLSGRDSPTLHEMQSPVPESPSGIGLSIATNSHIKAARGFKGISSRQRDVLCWSANSLERVYGRRTMSFLTLTLPELSRSDLVAVQGNWSEIVHTVTTYLQREFKKHGLTTHIVGCTEIQLERQERTGMSYPHLHLVFRGRFHCRAGWLVTCKRFRVLWRAAVSRFLSDSSYCWDYSENVQQVNKSCGGYLAKYISKSASKGGSGGGDSWYPSDWILCSRKLRGLYERLSRKGYDIGLSLLELVGNWRPDCGFKRPIEIRSDAYGRRKIGEWGWLKEEMTFPPFALLHGK